MEVVNLLGENVKSLRSLAEDSEFWGDVRRETKNVDKHIYSSIDNLQVWTKMDVGVIFFL